MPPSRRDFLQLACASAGSALLAGCGRAGPATSRAGPDTGATASSGSGGRPAHARSGSNVSATMQSLQAFLAANASPTFSLPAASTAPPSIAWTGPLTDASPPSTIANGVAIPVTSPMIGGPIRGGLTIPAGSPNVAGFPCLLVERNFTCKGQLRSVSSPTIVRLKTDAAVLELGGVVTDGTATVQTLIVNGQLAAPAVLSNSRGKGGGWNAGAIRIDFGTSAVRDVWIQTAMAPGYVKIGPFDTLFPIVDQGEPQITVVGDSYQLQQSASFANGSAIALELGARLGIRKVATDGIGGTGYWNSGLGAGNLNDRLAAHAADNSTIYLVMAGLNDYGDLVANGQVQWPAAVVYQQAVAGYISGLRARQPNALIVVTAPFCPVAPMSDSSYVANSTSNPSGLGDFLYKASLHKSALQKIAGPWIYVDVLMGTGWLNSSGASGDVTNLQWLTGGTPGPGTSPTYKPGNTNGGGGGGFGGVSGVPVLAGGSYTQAPNVAATGGSGAGLLLAATISSSGALTAIDVVSPGAGYTGGAGLPTVVIDTTFQSAAATLGTPTLMAGINPNGAYPLPSFAPPGSAGQLNDIYTYLLPDLTHPSPPGVSYISTRFAKSLFEAVMAL